MENRILIKLSGEALAGEDGFGLDRQMLEKIVEVISKVSDMKVQVGLVVGGGNFWRGRFAESIEPTTADSMGMLATVMNGLALRSMFNQHGHPASVLSAIPVGSLCESFNADLAKHYLSQGKILIFVGGTGNPFFTTDTAAVLRALEIEADTIYLAKNVDAIYSADPKIDKTAEKLTKLSYDDVLKKDLRVMDQTGITLCKDHQLPIKIFSLKDPDNLIKVLNGQTIGSVIS